MALLETRSRAGYLLLAAIVGLVLLISAQVNAKIGVAILEAVTFGVFVEAHRATTSLPWMCPGVWLNCQILPGVKNENEILKRQLADVQIQLQQQRALADRNPGLVKLLGLRDRLDLQTTAAEIVGV